MVQSSLKWLLGSSRRYKRLTWRSQGQLHLRLWFCSNYKKKKKKKTSYCTHRPMALFCDMNQSLIQSVWNYTKRRPRPFVLILWTSSFTLQVMKKLIFLANSHRPFIIVQWFLAWQTNTLNDCFRILTTLPASKLRDCYSYDPIVHGAKSSYPLPLHFVQCKADFGFNIKFTVNKPRNKLHVAQSCNPPRAIQSRQVIHSVSIVKVNKSLGYSVNTLIS